MILLFFIDVMMITLFRKVLFENDILMSPLRRIGYRKCQDIFSSFKLNFLLSESYILIECSLNS